MTAMNPADRYAALKLLETAIAAAVDAAKKDAEDYRAQVRAKALETDYGTVSVSRGKPRIIWDDDALITWCEDEYPNLVHKTIPTQSKKWLADNRFEIVGDDIIDREGGEAVKLGTVRPGSEYLTFRATDEAKAMALATVTERIEALTAVITPQIGAAS